jgi:hypothetical protein
MDNIYFKVQFKGNRTRTRALNTTITPDDIFRLKKKKKYNLKVLYY